LPSAATNRRPVQSCSHCLRHRAASERSRKSRGANGHALIHVTVTYFCFRLARAISTGAVPGDRPRRQRADIYDLCGGVFQRRPRRRESTQEQWSDQDFRRPRTSSGRSGAKSGSRVKKKAAFCGSGDLVIDTSTSDFRQQSCSIASSRAWNQLPDSLRSIRTVDCFKSALKTFVFNSQTPLTTCRHGRPQPCNGLHVTAH